MNIKSIGMYLVIFGIGSIVLNQMGREFTLLMWIDNWGETVGWAIRGGASALGVILWLVGHSQENSTDDAEAAADEA